jgi:hypothetical protein
VERVPRWSKRYTFQAFEMMLGDGCWGEMKYKQRLANILLTRFRGHGFPALHGLHGGRVSLEEDINRILL